MFIRKRHLYRNRPEGRAVSPSVSQSGSLLGSQFGSRAECIAPGTSRKSGVPVVSRRSSSQATASGQSVTSSQSVAPASAGASPRQSSQPISVALRGKPVVAPGISVRRVIFSPEPAKPTFWASLEPCLQSAERFNRLAPPLAFRINALSSGGIVQKGSRKRKGATPHDKHSATPNDKAGGYTQEQGGHLHGKRLRLRLLVLQAKRLPYLYDSECGQLYVPRLCLGVAVHEITAFESERDIEVPAAPGHDNWLWVIAFLSLLLFWDALRYSARSWGLDFLPHDSGLWVQVGALVKGKVLSGEWWRLFTALTLHADASHVLGNCVFGAIFMLPLCSRAGLGGGVFMTVLGGAFGNLLNIFFQAGGTRSIGFSTAVFAALGALCGLAACRFLAEYSFKKIRTQGAGALGDAATVGGVAALNSTSESGSTGIFVASRMRGVFLCLAAGLAFLAFLGGSGEPQVDFSAHVLGLAGGLLVSLPFASSFSQVSPIRPERAGQSSRPQILAQSLLLLIPLGLVSLSWYLAFTQ